jgi:hypothetical protein
MARVHTIAFNETDCIGDCYEPINNSLASLDTAVQDLSALNVVDTSTIDLTYSSVSRSLTASVKDNSISATQLALSAVTANSLYGEQTGSITDAPIYAARAWVNFNGTNTVGNNAIQTIRNQGNISSVTRIGTSTGLFQLTFTKSLPHNNYCVFGGMNNVNSGVAGNNDGLVSAYDLQTTGFKIVTPNGGAGLINPQLVYVAVIG